MELVKLDNKIGQHEFAALFTQKELDILRAYLGNSILNRDAVHRELFYSIFEKLKLFTSVQKESTFFSRFSINIR